MESPKVSIVIANLNGKHHLRECFDSISKLRYPKDKIEVIVVDNGSTDGSVALMQQKYGWVKLLCNQKNEGFAKPSNDGARAATGEYVAFINNDMRLQSDWLVELIGSMERSGAKCAGSVILNWDGKLLDFAGGGVNFCGLGYQDDFQCPMSVMEKKLSQDKEILFACGGAMIVERELFLFAGGFDEDYFAYYEDADLGWRLRVMGCKIVLSVKSRVFHKHNSTSKTIAKERIQYLFERNKLYTCFKNYDDELLHKVFLPSLLLQIREAYLSSGIDGFNYNIKNPGAFDSDPVNVGQRTAMKLSALNEFVETIAVMSKKRAFIQENRKAADSDIMKLIDKPFIVFEGDSGEFLNAEYDLVKAFGIDGLLSNRLKTNILFVAGANDGVDSDRAAKRCFELSKSLKAVDGLEVTVACSENRKIPEGCTVAYSRNDHVALMEAVRKSTVVVLMGLLPFENPEFARAVSKKYVVADIESCCNTADLSSKKMSASLKKIIGLADYFVCSDEKQKDYLTGMMSAFDACGAGNVAVIPCPLKDGAQNALVGYCSAPRHNAARMDAVELNLFDDSVPDSTVGQDTGDGDGNSAFEQLARIERQQTEIKQLLLSNKRMMKETHTGVSELKGWSLLMEKRFFKLKQKLMRFKFLRRFVG